jgi:AcrR family transcriptional regulator
MSERREELLDAAIDWLATNGVADMSLRPLASAIGSSPRLLIFHFKSKDSLLEAVMSELQRRLQESFTKMVAGLPPPPRESPMKTFWRWATNKANLPHLRILYEAHFISLQNPGAFKDYLEKTPMAWTEIIEGSLPESIRSKAMATLCGAVFDGLIIEYIRSGDLRRTTQSLDLFIEMLAAKAGVKLPPHRD